MFNLDLVQVPKLRQINGEKRYYETPDGNRYPSVTTVLGAMSDKSGLHAWRKRVGEEEANRVSSRAANRGTAVHKLCEQLILNRYIDLKSEMPSTISMYNQLEMKLLFDVDNVRGSEIQLFSHKLKVAGSCDLIADYKGKASIIDFKTSAKEKHKEWIESYFLQATIYSYMFWEMTGILYPQIVIMIAVEEAPVPQIFVEQAATYLDRARALCKAYHNKFS